MRGWGRRTMRSLERTGGVAALALILAGGVSFAEEEVPEPQWASHTAGLEAYGVSSLRIHPKEPDVLWAFVPGFGPSQSTDGGVTWVARKSGLEPAHVPGPRDPCRIVLDVRDPKTFWLATKGYVYRSVDEGATWENRSTQGLASYSWDRRRSAMLIRGLVVDPTRPGLRILAGTRTEGMFRGGLYESTNAGEDWELVAGTDVEKSELGHDAWPIVLDPRTDKNVIVGGSNGFWFSDDRGRHFRRTDPGEIGRHDVRHITEMAGRSRELFACDGRGLWGSRDGGKRWEKTPLLAGDCLYTYADPHARRRLYALLRDRGLMMSEDARHTKWSELGHADAEVHEVLAHPRNKELLYLASPVTGLHTSADQGVTIEPVQGNLPPVVPAVVAVTMHPTNVDRAMALTEHGVVFVSKDRGVTWERAGRTGTVPTTVYGDPENEDVWWVAGGKLLKTLDNGATWEVAYTPAAPEDRILGVQRLDDGAIWLLLERARVLARSEDGGQSWAVTRSPTASPGSWAAGFAVDPANPDHLLLATRTLTHLWTPKDEEGGPWESWDGGKTWMRLTEGLFEGGNPRRDWNRGRLAAIDPTTGILLYAADGLGLFARLPADPEQREVDAPTPAWVGIGPDLPNLRVNAFLLRLRSDGEGAEIVLQAEGANDTRTFGRISTARVEERLQAALGAQEGEEEENAEPPAPLWEELPDAPARLADLAADPHLEGRLLGCDRDGLSGVLAYGVPGARPTVEEPPPEEAVPGPKPPTGLLAFSAGSDGAVRKWRLSDGAVLSSLRGHTDGVLALALAPDGSLVATGGADKSVRLFDATTGTPSDKMIAPEAYDATVNALAFHPSSKVLYAGLEQNWALVEWNLETTETRAFEAHTGGVLCLAVSPDGKHVVSGSRDRTIRVWDAETGTTTRTIDVGTEVLSLALSPDGKRIYAAGRGAAVRVYDLGSGEQLARRDVHRAYVSGLAVSPDGARLYAVGDGGVLVVDAASLEPAGPVLEGPTKPVFCVALSNDEAWILAGDADNALWLWGRGLARPYWSSAAAHAGPVHGVVFAPGMVEPGEGGGAEAPPAEEGAAPEGEPGEGAAPEGEPGEGAAPEGEPGEGAAPEGEPEEGAAPEGEPGEGGGGAAPE